MNTISDWEELLAARLPLYGHRNWIVIADAAYPAHSAPGIETIVAGVSQQAVIEAVLAQLCACTMFVPSCIWITSWSLSWKAMRRASTAIAHGSGARSRA